MCKEKVNSNPSGSAALLYWMWSVCFLRYFTMYFVSTIYLFFARDERESAVQNIWVFVYCAFGAMLNKHTCFFKADHSDSTVICIYTLWLALHCKQHHICACGFVLLLMITQLNGHVSFIKLNVNKLLWIEESVLHFLLIPHYLRQNNLIVWMFIVFSN